MRALSIPAAARGAAPGPRGRAARGPLGSSLRSSALPLFAAASLLGACDAGVALTDSSRAQMQVSGGVFFAGPPPAGDPNASLITGITSPSSTIHPGEARKTLGGTVQDSAREIALYYAGDTGYWLVPVGLQDSSTPTDLDFSATLAFANDIDAGSHDIEVQATNADGTFGPASPYTVDVAPMNVPMSTLDVQLTWDTESDVDLHVTEPDGVTIWARNINAYQPPPPGSTDPPGDPTKFGMLDIDSNANCQIDGRREENVYWLVAPPSGDYRVNVDTWSLCGQPAARWHVTVTLNGNVIKQASGIGLDSDTGFTKDENAGVQALTFTVQ
jgi:hypothetical protein